MSNRKGERVPKFYGGGDIRDVGPEIDNDALNPDVEEDAEEHLEEVLEEDEEFRELWESEEPKRSIGTQVLRRRMELGWSQRELASKVNTSQNRIHLIESSEANPTVETLYRLARVLGLELEIRFSDSESKKVLDKAKSEATNSVQEAFRAAQQLSRAVVETSEQTVRAKEVWLRACEGAAEAQTWNVQLVRSLLRANESYSRSLFHVLFQRAAEQIERLEDSLEYAKYYDFVFRRQENALEVLWRNQEQALELINQNVADNWEMWCAQQYTPQEEYSSQAYDVPLNEIAVKWCTVDKEQEEAYRELMTESLEAYREFIGAPIAYYTEASSFGVNY